MIEQLPKRHRLPEVVLAGCILFASIPLAPALGFVGAQGGPNPADQGQAAAALPTDVGDSRSPLIEMEEAGITRQYLADQAVQQRVKVAVAAAKKSGTDPIAAATVAKALANSKKTPESATKTGAVPVAAASPKRREVHNLIKKYFPANQLGNAMAVATCESGLSDAVGATNSDGTTDWGVFQLNDGGTLQGALGSIGVKFGSVKQARELALDTERNVKAAASIYQDRGWAPWVCAYKISVVASLYSNTPGAMDGKFDRWGKPTVPVPVVKVDPAPADKQDDKNHPVKNGKPSPKPTPTPKPTPKPTPTDDAPEPTKKPSQSPTKTPEPTPSGSNPSGAASPSNSGAQSPKSAPVKSSAAAAPSNDASTAAPTP